MKQFHDPSVAKDVQFGNINLSLEQIALEFCANWESYMQEKLSKSRLGHLERVLLDMYWIKKKL